MAVPRQKLYGIEPGRLLLKGIAGRLDHGDRRTRRAAFEAAFSSATGLAGAIPVSRCRYGLARILADLCGEGRNEVILCPFTIFDMVNMVVAGGGRPVFVDSLPGAPHPSVGTIEARLGPRTAAVIVTHYHTPNPDIAAIAALCAARGVALIEDCAIGLGARVGGRSVGGFGDAGLFSFGLFKTIAAPYGGALVLRDAAWRARLDAETAAFAPARLADLQPYLGRAFYYRLLTSAPVFTGAVFPLVRAAFRRDWRAITGRLDNDPMPMARDGIPDAWRVRPGTAQLESWTRQLGKIGAILGHRRAVAAAYAAELGADASIGTPDAGPEGSFSCYPVHLPGGGRDAVMRAMIARGFDVTPHFYRNCAALPVFAEWHRPLPNLSDYCEKMLVLPCHLGVTPRYATGLAQALRAVVAQIGEDTT